MIVMGNVCDNLLANLLGHAAVVVTDSNVMLGGV